MGKFLRLKQQTDHHAIRLINLLLSFERYKLPAYQRILLADSEKAIKGRVRSSAAILAGNGPSFALLEGNIYDLSSVDVFTCNYSYKSSSFSSVAPTFHFIIDPKLVDGTWPVTMVDEIISLSPDTMVVLDVRWSGISEMQRFRNLSNVSWILPLYFPSFYSALSSMGFSSGFHGLNVVSCSFSVATFLGYRHLGIIGVEADGLFREIVNQPSHFYLESNRDVSLSSFDLMVDSLYLSTHQLYAWKGCVAAASRLGVGIYNLSNIGILDVCPRQSIARFLALAD